MAIFLWVRVHVTNKMPNESENLFESVYGIAEWPPRVPTEEWNEIE